jgi:hypothetical protein
MAALEALCRRTVRERCRAHEPRGVLLQEQRGAVSSRLLEVLVFARLPGVRRHVGATARRGRHGETPAGQSSMSMQAFQRHSREIACPATSPGHGGRLCWCARECVCAANCKTPHPSSGASAPRVGGRSDVVPPPRVPRSYGEPDAQHGLALRPCTISSLTEGCILQHGLP